MMNLDAVLVHKFGGLGDGTRCGKAELGQRNRVTLSWDSVTCPDCRAVKADWEPETQTIDTKGD